MKDKVAELRGILTPENPAAWVVNLWTNYNNQRQEKVSQWAEVDKYLFATDTTTTSNSSLPWTHNTTLPKLTQIRDNLHANYLSSIFPNDKWLKWSAYTQDSAKREKASKMEAYMENKTRMGNYRDLVSRLLYDYIDYGNAFVYPVFERRYEDRDGERLTSFIGPKSYRISPYDIVFNPLAASFEQSFKIVRSIETVGSLKKMIEKGAGNDFWQPVVDKRKAIKELSNGFSYEDWQKASQYDVDGFGNLQEYYQSGSVEILEFYGDFYDPDTDTLQTNRMVTVVDRTMVVRNVPIPTYSGEANIRSVGWRLRPDNLWAMGPLDNLVGMQYMIDHYLNMGANALDLKVMPPKKIIGEVEEFNWEPNAEIHIDENGDVQEMAQNFNDVFTVKEWIENLEMRMELYAGAPREAMGIRSPGEKTAFEVQVLENASSRIFQEKINQFEMFLEKNLNDMLEVAHRNMDQLDTIRVLDDDFGVEQFFDITKEDITADGIIRPIGARHFAQKANELQNLIGIFNSPIGQLIAPHTSAINLTAFLEDVVNIKAYDIFAPNIAVQEQQQLQSLVNQAEEDNEVAAMQSEEELMMEAAQLENQAVQEQV